MSASTIDSASNPASFALSIEISARAAAQVAQGQLWIFSNEIVKKPTDAVPGQWAIFRFRDRVIASGYFNPHSLIAGRVLALGQVSDPSPLLRNRLETAFRRREGLQSVGSARLVFSESDFFPGLVLDWYSAPGSDILVLQSNTAGMDALLPTIKSLVGPAFEAVFGRAPTGIVLRADAGVRHLEGVQDFTKVLEGSEKSLAQGTLVENGTLYAADFIGGQKTGFFLDQRDNRTFLRIAVASAPGGTLLDLFSYSGGWGLAALKSGAAHATFVDQSADAMRLVTKGLALNAIDEKKATLIESDVFDYLAKEDGPTFDIVVSDPPAFVRSKKTLPQAMKAYEKLNRLAWKRVKPGGLLISCSCSYHLSTPEFLDVIRTAVGKEKGVALLTYQGGQPMDHPILLSMPETRYLKCVGLRKIDFN